MVKQFIDNLGGSKRVADELDVNHGAVRMWLTPGRAIPWKYRHQLARIAAERAVPLPEGYWDADAKAA